MMSFQESNKVGYNSPIFKIALCMFTFPMDDFKHHKALHGCVQVGCTMPIYQYPTLFWFFVATTTKFNMFVDAMVVVWMNKQSYNPFIICFKLSTFCVCEEATYLQRQPNWTYITIVKLTAIEKLIRYVGVIWFIYSCSPTFAN